MLLCSVAVWGEASSWGVSGLSAEVCSTSSWNIKGRSIKGLPPCECKRREICSYVYRSFQLTNRKRLYYFIIGKRGRGGRGWGRAIFIVGWPLCLENLKSFLYCEVTFHLLPGWGVRRSLRLSSGGKKSFLICRRNLSIFGTRCGAHICNLQTITSLKAGAQSRAAFLFSFFFSLSLCVTLYLIFLKILQNMDLQVWNNQAWRHKPVSSITIPWAKGPSSGFNGPPQHELCASIGKGRSHSQDFIERAHKVTLAGPWVKRKMAPSLCFSSPHSQRTWGGLCSASLSSDAQITRTAPGGFPWGIWGLEFGGSTFYSYAGKTSRPLQPLHMFVPGGGGQCVVSVCGLSVYLHTYPGHYSCLCLPVCFLPSHPRHQPYFPYALYISLNTQEIGRKKKQHWL